MSVLQNFLPIPYLLQYNTIIAIISDIQPSQSRSEKDVEALDMYMITYIEILGMWIRIPWRL